MSFNIKKYEQSVGPAYACQLSLKLFIEDNKNELSLREKAELLYEWLGYSEADIDFLFELQSYEICLFMIDVLEKYPLTNTNDSNLMMQYNDAYDSLIYQKNII